MKLIKKIKKQLPGYVLGLISGLFLFYAQEKIRLNLERAEVSVKPQGIVFLKDKNDSWQMTFY